MSDNKFEIEQVLTLRKEGGSAEAELKKVREQVKGATDDSEAYAAALAKMQKAEHDAKVEEYQHATALAESKKKTEQLAEATQQAALDNVAFTNDTKNAAKAVGQTSGSLADLKKSVALVGGELGGLGQLLRYVFNPGILGAAALAAAIGKVVTTFGTFAEGLKNSAINAAKSIGNIKQAMLELEIERIKSDVNFKTLMEDFERKSKRKIEVINLEKDAVLQLLDAREKADLAAAKTPEEKAAIENRYATARQRTQAQATQKEIAARRDELNGMESMAKRRFSEGFKASGGRTPERVKLDLKKMPGELASLDEQIIAQEKLVEELSSITSPANAFLYWNDPENYRTQLQAYTTSKTGLDSMRKERKRIEGRQTPLTTADTAYDAAIGLFGQVRTGREDLNNFKSDTTSKQQTDWRADAITSGKGTAGDLVSSAASGADALKAGSKISQDQAQAIAQMTQLLGLTGQSNATILAVLGRMNDNQTSFQNSLKTLESRVSANNQRM